MKIKLDENIPVRLVDALVAYGHDVDTVPQEGCQGKDDETVWRAAQEAGRFFITQDLDFSDVRRFLPGTHRGLLVVRLREPGRDALVEVVQKLFESRDAEQLRGCFVLASEHKIRIRSPRRD